MDPVGVKRTPSLPLPAPLSAPPHPCQPHCEAPRERFKSASLPHTHAYIYSQTLRLTRWGVLVNEILKKGLVVKDGGAKEVILGPQRDLWQRDLPVLWWYRGREGWVRAWRQKNKLFYSWKRCNDSFFSKKKKLNFWFPRSTECPTYPCLDCKSQRGLKLFSVSSTEEENISWKLNDFWVTSLKNFNSSNGKKPSKNRLTLCFLSFFFCCCCCCSFNPPGLSFELRIWFKVCKAFILISCSAVKTKQEIWFNIINHYRRLYGGPEVTFTQS